MIAQSQPPSGGTARSVQFERIDPLVGDDWDFRVTQHPAHSVFHRSAWAWVLAETYDHRPFYLRAFVDGVEAALVPLMEVRSPLTGRRGISLPFSDFAGPLWTSPCQKADVYHSLQDFAADRKWHHLEIRGGESPETDANVIRTYHAHQLDLRAGISRIAADLPENTRRSIRRAEQSGVDVRISNDFHDMVTFYQLHGRTRRRHGLPPQPLAFFQSIHRHLIEPGLGFIVLALHAGTAVAGAIFLHSGSRAIFKFGASDRELWTLRPNHCVMWTAIQYLVRIGCQHLDFGRTTNNDIGLIRFKESWGSSADTLRYYRYHIGRQAWITGAGTTTERFPYVFGNLPLALNRLAGRLIYPHLD